MCVYKHNCDNPKYTENLSGEQIKSLRKSTYICIVSKWTLTALIVLSAPGYAKLPSMTYTEIHVWIMATKFAIIHTRRGILGHWVKPINFLRKDKNSMNENILL